MRSLTITGLISCKCIIIAIVILKCTVDCDASTKALVNIKQTTGKSYPLTAFVRHKRAPKTSLCIPKPAKAKWIDWPTSERIVLTGIANELPTVGITTLASLAQNEPATSESNILSTASMVLTTPLPLQAVQPLTLEPIEPPTTMMIQSPPGDDTQPLEENINNPTTITNLNPLLTATHSPILPPIGMQDLITSHVFLRTNVNEVDQLTTISSDDATRNRETKYISETTCPPRCTLPLVPLKEDLIRLIQQAAELADSGLFTQNQFTKSKKDILKLIEKLRRVNVIENVLARDQFEPIEEVGLSSPGSNTTTGTGGATSGGTGVPPDYCSCAPEDRCHKLKSITIKEYRNVYKTYEY